MRMKKKMCSLKYMNRNMTTTMGNNNSNNNTNK